jgi:4-amino-4-deoxy-L-arabinose transferase-like glycosyltransferase
LGLQTPLNGRPLILAVHRGSLQKQLTVIPRPLPAERFWDLLLGSFGNLWLLLFAALIAWRRADVPQMRLLSLWLAAFVLVGATSGFAAPWAWVYILYYISIGLAPPLVLMLWAAFAGCFAQPRSRLRRITQRLCYAFGAISIASSVFWIAEIINPQFHPLPSTNGLDWYVPFVGALVMAVVCSVLAIAASRGVERQRAVWTIVPLAAIFCYYTVFAIASSSASSYADAAFWGIVGNLVILAAPLGLTYAALSRRLIDVGFILNRAVIFAIVSTIVIGAFVLVEWAMSEWLARTGRTASIVISMGAALGIGFSMRYIHVYVDRFVDRVFFRKRHEDEAALRRFAHEASYITDRSVLLERAVRTVEEHTGAADATILVHDGAAGFTSAAETDGPRTSASENDPGILALRAWRKPIDLVSLEGSVLRGEFAFPMVSRGVLVGALVCGAKRNGESYAPDESEALLALAHGVGTALDVLSAQRDRPNEIVLSKLDALHEDLKLWRGARLDR